MALLEINNAASDSRLACYRDLRWNEKPGSDSDWFVVEGRLCVRRLVESPLQTLSILVERGKEGEIAAWADDSTPVYSVPSDQVRQLVGYDFHRGMLACGRRPELLDSEKLDLTHSPTRLAIAAIGVDHRENLGSMLRTAAAMGIDQIVVSPQTADPYARRTVRVSMAAVLRQTLYQMRDPEIELRQLSQSQRIRTIVTALTSDATPLDQFELDDRPCLLVMGSEAHGVDPSVAAAATDRVTIPMKLGTDSLNVSVAAAIFMYELAVRRR